ncbi:hypothetical protein [Elstera sp.]|uniref:hypothetical protein n=1 Tax=Elstera sp. TaxID=1916664 RepID=UPI0037C0D764
MQERQYFSKEEYYYIRKLVGGENAETYFQSYGYYKFPEEDWGGDLDAALEAHSRKRVPRCL